jgi:hypothetical protein
MSLSIEELDATVRAFFEGRGETVGFILLLLYDIEADLFFSQQKQAQATLNQVRAQPRLTHNDEH